MLSILFCMIQIRQFYSYKGCNHKTLVLQYIIVLYLNVMFVPGVWATLKPLYSQANVDPYLDV